MLYLVCQKNGTIGRDGTYKKKKKGEKHTNCLVRQERLVLLFGTRFPCVPYRGFRPFIT